MQRQHLETIKGYKITCWYFALWHFLEPSSKDILWKESVGVKHYADLLTWIWSNTTRWARFNAFVSKWQWQICCIDQIEIQVAQDLVGNQGILAGIKENDGCDKSSLQLSASNTRPGRDGIFMRQLNLQSCFPTNLFFKTGGEWVFWICTLAGAHFFCKGHIFLFSPTLAWTIHLIFVLLDIHLSSN